MAYEQKDNSGALFVNDKREKDSHPTHKGDAKIDGKMYWVSAWEKQTKNGTQMFSISFKEKEPFVKNAMEKAKSAVKQNNTIAMMENAQEDPDLDDSIPF